MDNKPIVTTPRDQNRIRIHVVNSDYQFLTVWRVAGTVAEVVSVLGNAGSLPRWWPSVYLAVVPGEPGASDGTGKVVHVHTTGWLPYTLRWSLTITEPITPSGFALTAAGDLNGTGRWTFEQDGPEVVISYDWRVSATKPLLRRLSWLLKPLFSANHRWAMARGEESLRLELRRQRASGRSRDLVPPPPPPTFRWLYGRSNAALRRCASASRRRLRNSRLHQYLGIGLARGRR